jgi:DNA-binding MarR family transcriptional regulator
MNGTSHNARRRGEAGLAGSATLEDDHELAAISTMEKGRLMESLESGEIAARKLVALPGSARSGRRSSPDGAGADDLGGGGGGDGSLPGGATIDAAITLLAGLRQLDSEMTLQVAQCFLAVASHPGMTVREMAAVAEVEESTASRNAGILGRYGRGAKEGYRVIEFEDDPNDRRVRRLRLTDKGRRLLRGALRRMQDVVLSAR